MEKIKIKVVKEDDLLTMAQILVRNGYTVKKGKVTVPGRTKAVSAVIAWEGGENE